MILYVFIIFILLIIVLYTYFEISKTTKKYITGVVNNKEETLIFFKKIENYFLKINNFLKRLNINEINYIKLDGTDPTETMKNYIKKYKETNNYLNENLTMKIKNKNYFKKYKSILLDFFKFIYEDNLQYDSKNKIKEYYEIFEDKLNRDLNCCATLWNINLFFEHLNKNFNIKK